MLFSPSPAYTIIIRLRIKNRVGMIGKILTIIGEAGGEIRGINLIDTTREWVIREIHVNTAHGQHAKKIIEELSKIEGVVIEEVVDRTFLAHKEGKIEVISKRKINSTEDLSRVYTPGVARVVKAIHQVPDAIWFFTIKANTVAIVTDGTAVLGLGKMGPEAALPVMEGKAAIFKEFAGINGFPICLKTTDIDEIVETIKLISTSFGAINLEDISAPRCFEIEERLKKELDIPVFHDDQHGTATVVLAGLFNALKIVGKRFPDIKVVINGAGASAIATAKILLKVGVKNIILCDSKGAIYRGRKEKMNKYKEEIAELTNPENYKGDLKGALKGADVFIGLSVGNVLKGEDLKVMAKDPIVFALANPTPEVPPEEATRYARIVATGRSDYPNQINNALGYPGIFKGALQVYARDINDDMKIAAAKAIASVISDSELSEDYIIPSIFDKRVVPAVAEAVANTAILTGVARKIKPFTSFFDI